MRASMRYRLITLVFYIMILVTFGRLNAQGFEKVGQEGIQALTLEACIEMALDRHVKQQIARESLNIVEAQRKQVLSSYWPQLSASALYSVTDQEPTFIFPESKIQLPAEFSQVLSALLGVNIDLPPMPIPEQHINLMDRQNLAASVKLTMPLYTGGIRSALKEQANLGIQIARGDIQKTQHEIKRDVKKYYYAVVLTKHLIEIGQEAYERLDATLNLTETLYKNGSGRVKKTDYLKNKLIVDNIKILMIELKKKNQLAQAALKFSIGLPWSEPITLAENTIPYIEMTQNLDAYIQRMLTENLELQKVRLATQLFDQKVKESRGHLYPHVGLVGQYTRLFNRYDTGMMTPENKQVWLIGLGINYSFFNGFRFKNKVQEQLSRASQLRQKYTLFTQGLTLMMQSQFYQLMAAQEGVAISREVHATATENLDLVERAYQIEILTEKDLIEAQIIEALMKAKLEKAFYDHFLIRTDLEYILSEKVTDFIKGSRLETN